MDISLGEKDNKKKIAFFQYPDFEWDSATQGLVLARYCPTIL